MLILFRADIFPGRAHFLFININIVRIFRQYITRIIIINWYILNDEICIMYTPERHTYSFISRNRNVPTTFDATLTGGNTIEQIYAVTLTMLTLLVHFGFKPIVRRCNRSHFADGPLRICSVSAGY